MVSRRSLLARVIALAAVPALDRSAVRSAELSTKNNRPAIVGRGPAGAPSPLGASAADPTAGEAWQGAITLYPEDHPEQLASVGFAVRVDDETGGAVWTIAHADGTRETVPMAPGTSVAEAMRALVDRIAGVVGAPGVAA